MDKKKLHINEAGSPNYPEPDIPAEEAWNSMQQLLQQAPEASASNSALEKNKLLSKIIAITGTVVIVSTIIYMMTRPKEKPVPSVVTPAAAVVTTQRDTLSDGSIADLDYTNRVFEFSNMRFIEAAAYIEKAYNVKIIIKNNKIDNCTITTRFDNKSLEEVFDILGFTLGFEYKIDNTKNQVTISGDGCN